MPWISPDSRKQRPGITSSSSAASSWSVLGLNQVFILHDSNVSIKIPSDFAGIALATYDGARIEHEPTAAVRNACSRIEEAISNAPLKEIEGQWCQRYTESVDIAPRAVEEDIEVAVFADTVSLVRYNESRTDTVFEARGRLVENRIRGDWRHRQSQIFDHGAFLLVLNTRVVCVQRCLWSRRRAVFEAWVLAKKRQDKRTTIAERLAWGEREAQEADCWAARRSGDRGEGEIRWSRQLTVDRVDTREDWRDHCLFRLTL